MEFYSFLITRTNVRLGDHDLSLSKNCAGRHCGNPMRVNEIDEVIAHESFDPRAVNRKHDIGLVRLRNSVQYSSKNVARSFESSTHSPRFQVSFDRFVFHPRPTQTCSQASPLTSSASVELWNQRWAQSSRSCDCQFSATHSVGKDSPRKTSTSPTTRFARAASFPAMLATEVSERNWNWDWKLIELNFFSDSGGPLMRFKDSWIVEGIVSFGYLCGLQGWPAVYTKVSSYTEWIDKHIKP